MTRTIAIVVQPNGTFDVHEGENVAQSLTTDELLGELARIGLGQRPRYMKPIDDIVNWRWQRTRREKILS